MGGIAGNPRGVAGGATGAAGGLNGPQQRRIRPVQPIHRLPSVNPIQPIRAKPAGEGFVFGNQRTMNVAGAPKLPQNPYVDAAWRRQTYGPR